MSQQQRYELPAADGQHVTVTPTVIELRDGKVFATANITSVSTETIQLPRPPIGCQIALIVCGAVLGVVSLAVIGYSPGAGLLMLLLLGIVPFGAGVAWLKSVKAPPPIYVLKLCSAAAEQEFVRSHDWEWIYSVAQAVIAVIVARG